MKCADDKGFSLIELLVVMFLLSVISYFAWDLLSGWRERNAIRSVSQDVKHMIERYRQRAIDKGYNYGLIFSDDGIYVFEDNGGSGSEPFLAMNNYAIETGEFSDKYRGGPSGDSRLWRRVTDSTSEFSFFAGPDARGRLIVMTMNSLGLNNARSGGPYTISGTDISSQAVVDYTGSSESPFASGTLALFFSPDGLIYLKDPTVSVAPMDRYAHELGTTSNAFYVIRIAYDDPLTTKPELPTYFEVAINRYGSSSLVRWQTGDGGASWYAEQQ